MDGPSFNFDHSHHKLKIRGLNSSVDVLFFEGREQLSAPFRYDIQFTSSDKSIAPESVLMQDGSFSLTAPPVQGVLARSLHQVIPRQNPIFTNIKNMIIFMICGQIFIMVM